MSDDINAVVEDATAQATSSDSFDALAFFSGSSLPQDFVTVYADVDAAYRLNDIRQQYEAQKERDEDEGSSITDDRYVVDEDEVAALQERIKASSVIFNLRGLAPAAKTAIEKKARASNPYVEGAENREYNEEFNAALIANTIVSVQNSKGQTDPNKWDAARVAKFSDVAPESEFGKLALAVMKVNYVADAIDQAVSADFS